MAKLSKDAEARLGDVWTTYLSSDSALPPALGEVPPPSLLDFLAYSVTFIHETGGRLDSSSERYNPDNPALKSPGIAYLYDRLLTPGGYQKKSYNTAPNVLLYPLLVTRFSRSDLSVSNLMKC